jgi:hypothetical protein
MLTRAGSSFPAASGLVEQLGKRIDLRVVSASGERTVTDFAASGYCAHVCI